MQYTGRENDGTAQQFNRGRYYDPVLKRWLSEDPIGIAGGLNLYAYVNGQPISATDPLGLLSPLQHARITLEAFNGSGFSDAFAWEVVREAVKFDFVEGSQSIELAYTHAMIPRGGDPFAAGTATNSFINYQSRLCTARGLGWALHAAQDKYARGHNQEYGGLLRFDMIFHTIDDWFPSQDRRAVAIAESRRLIREFQQHCKACR